MSLPVLVRSSLRTWDFTLLVLVGVAAFVGGWIALMNGERAVGITLQVVGGLCAAGSAIGLRRRISRRQWATLNDSGFTLSDRRGETDYTDAEVRSMALHRKPNYIQGVERSVTRTLLVWLRERDADTPPERLELTTTYKTGAADPLDSLINRLSRCVLDLARKQLAEGSTFAGNDWVLEEQNLVIAAKPAPLHAPLDEIVMTGVVDQKLCLWRRGEDEVWARIPIDSINAYVLKWLLDERLAECESEAEEPVAGGLGRVLFERKPGRAQVVSCVLVGPVALMAGIWLIVDGIVGKRDPDVWLGIVGMGCLAGAIGCGYGIVHARFAKFRCHQFGLVKRGVRNSKTMRYEHVEQFTYQATRTYHNGVYTGTLFALDFEPFPEHQANRIRYMVNIQNADSELDNLRDQVSTIIGTRMRRDINAGREVVWTPGLTFRGDTLLYRASGFLGRNKVAVAIPLSEIGEHQCDEGTYRLFLKSGGKAVVQESTSVRNFYPGFYCMAGLIGATTR